MCKLLVGLVFLVILALELFFNRLRNGWLHTVRVVLAFYIAQALPRGNGWMSYWRVGGGMLVSGCFAFLYRIVYKFEVEPSIAA
jgi:hypothetical protein